jgi:tetratricopeptide (TPR) repeat protein
MFAFLFTGCKVDNRDDIDRMLDNTRENLKQEGKKFNAKNREWDSLINNIYEVSKQNQILAYKKIDGIILNNPQLEEFDIQDLHFVKGDILYKNDSLNEAVVEFTKSGINFPKSLAARARAFLKLKEYKKCLLDLNKAAEINHEYLWHIGNYYEVLNKKDSAVYFYRKLLENDKVIYKYCGDRIKELENKKTKLYTELKFIDNPRITIILPE